MSCSCQVRVGEATEAASCLEEWFAELSAGCGAVVTIVYLNDLQVFFFQPIPCSRAVVFQARPLLRSLQTTAVRFGNGIVGPDSDFLVDSIESC